MKPLYGYLVTLKTVTVVGSILTNILRVSEMSVAYANRNVSMQKHAIPKAIIMIMNNVKQSS